MLVSISVNRGSKRDIMFVSISVKGGSKRDIMLSINVKIQTLTKLLRLVASADYLLNNECKRPLK